MATASQTWFRIAFAALAWLLLTGDAFISCSSDPGKLGSGNRPPTAADSFYTLSSDETLTGFMRATDPDGDALTYRIVTGPRLGSLRDVDSASGQFTYIPGETGTDSFSFRASDGSLESNTAVVTIQVIDGSTGAPGSKPSGVRQVAADPLVPGAIIALWKGPLRTLQRIYPENGSPPRTLARDVAWFDLDPLSPGSITVGTAADRVVVSRDGGATWRPGAAARPEVGCGREENRPRDGELLSAPCSGSTAGFPAEEVAEEHRPAIGIHRSVLADPYRSGGWWMALSGDSTELFYSSDGGLDWRAVLAVDIPDLRLTECGEYSVCLIDSAGAHLWRFPNGF
ncbi:MAG: Ig-like domain-containing protein [Gammaproteobacteria bacterium]|jgi:hypothetical protein